MKTQLIFALVASVLSIGSFAQAEVNPKVLGTVKKMVIGGAALNQQALLDSIVASVGSYGKVLVGNSNVTNALGSTSFSLPMVLRTHQRAELRAALHVNQQGQVFDYGVSSNPEAYHLDVNFISATSNAVGTGVRLEFRPALTHTTPARVATRILVYDAIVNASSGAGRLVATVQQRAVPEQRIWRTTATYIKFLPN